RAIVKDSIIYNVIHRDTVVYRYLYDTIRIKHFVHADTVWESLPPAETTAAVMKKRKVININPNNFGIGPSVGAYYSPFNGFDVNIGFGVQYYFLSIPTIRRPHLRHHRK